MHVRPFALSLFLLLVLAGSGCDSRQGLMPLVVSVPGRSMSKLPFVIAADQGLYEKHGVDVELRLPPPEFAGGKRPNANFWDRVWRKLGLQEYPQPDIIVNGHTPAMVNQIASAVAPERIAVASTDCSVRYYVIARPEIESLDALKGKRIGSSPEHTTPGFATLRLLQRMGWSPQQDVSIVRPADVELLRDGSLDAIVGGDDDYEAAQQQGFPVLLDTRAWNEQLAGNSVLVEPEWLEDGINREATRRFLMAVTEAIAIFHEDPELVMEILAEWHGMTDKDLAEGRYERTDYIPRKPYPCSEGIRNTMELYDSHAMRQYQADDFYDASLMREIDESGFIDGLYD